MKKMNLTMAVFASLAVISCSVPLSENIGFSENISFNYSKKLQIRGTVSFPDKSFQTQATLSDIGSQAVVSLLLPPDDLITPDKTIVTGLTDSSGNFMLNVNFTPTLNKIYLLEASKRIGGPGNQVISLRTYLKWNGSTWESITASGISINSKTTAICILDYYNSSISANDTLNTIVSGTVSDIGSVTASTINHLADLVVLSFSNDLDPVRFISYQNNKYFIRREEAHNKNYLELSKYCPNCDLTKKSFTGFDFSGADLSNTNLNKAIFSGTNLSNANLTNSNLTGANFTEANLNGANLSGTTITNTNFSNATWSNGLTCAYGSIGRCIFPDTLVNTYTTSYQYQSAMAMDADGDFVVTWTSIVQDSNTYGVYAQRYASNGSSVGSELKVNTYTNLKQQLSSVAMDADGDFVITWASGGQDGSGYGIYSQLYNSAGDVTKSEFRINTYTTNAQSNPSVAMDDNGNFVVTWTSNGQDGNNLGVYAQLYNASGSPVGVEFRVNNSTSAAQNEPSVAMDADGDFVIAWQTRHEGNVFSYEIYAKRYSSAGVVINSDFKVNTYTSYIQNLPSVAIDDDGDFVIAWSSLSAEDNLDPSGTGIFAQRYNSSGAKVGTQFLVNTSTVFDQTRPSVSMDADGDFVVAWQSNEQDGSNYGVYGKRYSSDGTVVGSEFRANGYTTSNQRFPFLAMDADGDFSIVWESNAQDGYSYGVYLKRYNSSGFDL